MAEKKAHTKTAPVYAVKKIVYYIDTSSSYQWHWAIFAQKAQMMDLFSLTVVHTTVPALAWPGLMAGASE